MPDLAAALQSVRTQIIDWRAEAERQGRALLVATARAGHAKIMHDQPDSTWTAFGDVPGKSWEQAERLIVFKYSPALGLVIPAIVKLLEDASPVDSGLYRRSHMVFVNGQPWDGAPIPAGAAVMIANTVPYARRLEIGKTESGRAFLVSVPNKIYERVARRASTTWPTVQIEFGYTVLANAYVSRGVVGSRSSNRRRRYRAGRGKGREVASPVIYVGRRQ